jgi:putative ABC transport system permease protein
MKKSECIRRSDLLALATGSLVANKLRSSLTIAGIVVGVFSVVAVMTALSAMRQSINTGLSQLGANTFQISKMPAINARWWEYMTRPIISLDQAEQFQKLMKEQSPNSLVAYTIGSGGYKATYRGVTMDSYVQMVGANENSIITNNYKVASGRNISADDVSFARPVVVIGHSIAKELFPAEDPLGKRIMISGHSYSIVGVLEEKGEVFGNDQDGLAAIPVTVFAQHCWNRRWQSIDISVQAAADERMESVQDVAIGVMRIVRRLPPEEFNNFEVYSNDTLKATFDKMAVIIGAAGLIISAIALLTAGVGVMNIMLVSVTERTREIGVRKSIGARSRDILIQFLLESVFIAQIGAVIGIVLGVAAGDAAGVMLNADPIVPWFWIVVAVVTCGGIGIGFGAYPAWKAARMDPVEALRFE